MVKRYSEQQEIGDFRVALICAHILNTIPRTQKTKNKVFQPWDIFPAYRDKWQSKAHELSPEQLKNKVRLINMALGGKEVKKYGQ